jgi:hypothetical protein
MGGDADRTLCRFSSVRMLMHGECNRRPEGQQQAQTRYPFRYRPHDGYPMEAFFESIPKRQTNATREYLARYVLGTSATPMLHENSKLLVPQMLGRFCLAVPSDLSRLYSSPVFCVYWPPVLVVVIGKTRVKTQHDDDHCPKNDQ